MSDALPKRNGVLSKHPVYSAFKTVLTIIMIFFFFNQMFQNGKNTITTVLVITIIIIKVKYKPRPTDRDGSQKVVATARSKVPARRVNGTERYGADPYFIRNMLRIL